MCDWNQHIKKFIDNDMKNEVYEKILEAAELIKNEPTAKPEDMLVVLSMGAKRMLDERTKQIIKYNYTAKNQAENPYYYDQGQLKSAAIKLLSVSENNTPDMILAPLHWDEDWFYKLLNEPYEERLVIAGALLAAEVDRICYINNQKVKNNG